MLSVSAEQRRRCQVYVANHLKATAGHQVLVGPREVAVDDGVDADGPSPADVVDGDVAFAGRSPRGHRVSVSGAMLAMTFVSSDAVRPARAPARTVQSRGGEGGEGGGGAALGGCPRVNLVGVDPDAGRVDEDVTDAEVEEIPAGGLASADFAEDLEGREFGVVVLAVGHDGDEDPSLMPIGPLVAARELEGGGDGVE